MKPWKPVLALTAACAACCAVPLLGGAAVLTLGASVFTAVGAALWACRDEVVALAAVLAVASAAIVGGAWWRRRARHRAASSTGCQGSCQVDLR
ncbi:hypothetical protein [Rhizobacter sp. LjRoot28]|uniref:hypothetical protein n=1 Tax=Rhizobacter sp. LjRoot28 TaxID=3342309 RepID=UPI003ECF4BF2